MKRRLSLVLFAVVLCALSSCAPRGEAKSVAEILESAKARFREAGPQDVSSVVSEDMTAIVEALLALEQGESSSGDAAERARSVASILSRMEGKAGYTSRPAFGELATQYVRLGSDSSEKKGAHIPLLVARTYSLLARELETTRFKF